MAVDAKNARIIDFQLGDGHVIEEASRTIGDPERVARRLRTVERRHGRDDVHDLTAYFDDIATALTETPTATPVVVLGAGHGKADLAPAFADRVHEHHHLLGDRVRGVGDIDLSAATDADLEAAARLVLDRP